MATVRRPRRLLLLLGLITGIGPFSIDMYLPALPPIADEFDAGASRVQLTLSACLVGLAVGQLLVGPVSDRWGRRRPALVGLVLYTATSLLCTAAPTVEVLTAARLVQGVAGGATVVIARAVVRDLYSGVAAAAYFSRLVLVFGIAPVIAPTVGGLVLRFTDWRGVFVVLAAIGAVTLAVTFAGLPETLPPTRRQRGGLRDTVAGMRAILGDRAFLGYALALSLAGAGMFAYISGSSFVLQRVYGASAQLYGLLFGLNALGFVLVGQLNGWLVHRYPPRRLLAVGLVVLAVAAVTLLAVVRWNGLLGTALLLFAFMAALGVVLPNTTALALDLHPERAGAASALLGTAQSILGAVAAPVVGLAGADTATPMVLTMSVAAAGSLAAFALVRTRRFAVAGSGPDTRDDSAPINGK
jgi:DHA1 family bicyclomycin/chloramphenicol resistance-like MFS transporter